MVPKTKTRPLSHLEQGWIQVVRYLIIVFTIGGFAFFFLLLYSAPLHPLASRKFPDSRTVSIETILNYSEFNPSLFTDRERIQFLLEVTESGKRNLKEVMKLRKTSVQGTRPMSTEPPNASWISPFMEFDDKYLARFLQISKKWLGDGDRLDPRMVEDLVRTVKRPLDQNAANWWNATLNTTKLYVDIFEGENRYRSCAVVRNSEMMLKKNYGKQIDSNDMVIRLNNADVSKYTTQLGNKTTLSFMDSNVFQRCAIKCVCDKYGKQVPIILYISQTEQLPEVARDLCNRKSLLLVAPSLFDALCGAIVKWYSVTNFLQTTIWGLAEWSLAYDEFAFRHSSDMEAVVLALGICEHVNLFGFEGATNDAGNHHCSSENCHDYVSEYRFYDDLVFNRKIPFLTDAGISLPKVRIFR